VTSVIEECLLRVVVVVESEGSGGVDECEEASEKWRILPG
jgi:hypothetical protein